MLLLLLTPHAHAFRFRQEKKQEKNWHENDDDFLFGICTPLLRLAAYFMRRYIWKQRLPR